MKNKIAAIAVCIPTYVFNVDNPATVDTMFLTLIDSRGQQVYNAPVKVSAVQGTAAYRVGGQTTYYTILPKPYLKHFTATLRIRYADGILSPVKNFTKN